MRKEKETQIENSSIKSHKMNQKEGNSMNKLKLISVDKMDNFCKIKLLNLTQQETGKLNTLISIKGNEVLNVKHSHRGNSKFRWYHFRNQFSSVAQLCPTLCNPMDCSMPGIPVHHQSWSLLKLMSIESVMPSNHLILCHPLLLLPSIFPSIRAFSRESVLCIRWPKYGVSASALVLPVNIQD